MEGIQTHSNDRHKKLSISSAIFGVFNIEKVAVLLALLAWMVFEVKGPPVASPPWDPNAASTTAQVRSHDPKGPTWKVIIQLRIRSTQPTEGHEETKLFLSNTPSMRKSMLKNVNGNIISQVAGSDSPFDWRHMKISGLLLTPLLSANLSERSLIVLLNVATDKDRISFSQSMETFTRMLDGRKNNHKVEFIVNNENFTYIPESIKEGNVAICEFTQLQKRTNITQLPLYGRYTESHPTLPETCDSLDPKQSTHTKKDSMQSKFIIVPWGWKKDVKNHNTAIQQMSDGIQIRRVLDRRWLRHHYVNLIKISVASTLCSFGIISILWCIIFRWNTLSTIFRTGPRALRGTRVKPESFYGTGTRDNTSICDVSLIKNEVEESPMATPTMRFSDLHMKSSPSSSDARHEIIGYEIPRSNHSSSSLSSMVDSISITIEKDLNGNQSDKDNQTISIISHNGL